MKRTFGTHCEKAMGDSPGFIFVSHTFTHTHTCSLVRLLPHSFVFLFVPFSFILSFDLPSFRLVSYICDWVVCIDCMKGKGTMYMHTKVCMFSTFVPKSTSQPITHDERAQIQFTRLSLSLSFSFFIIFVFIRQKCESQCGINRCTFYNFKCRQ